MLNEERIQFYTKQIVLAIFGKKSFRGLPNRRADKFFQSKRLKAIRTDTLEAIAFDSAFAFLKQNNFLNVMYVDEDFINTQHYYDAIDLDCHYAKKDYDKIFIGLTQLGFDAWYVFRKTGKWQKENSNEVSE